MDFVSIDVETANADMASICQIGIAKYSNNILEDEWVTFINPEDYFDHINIEIHGIDEDTVINSPTLPESVSMIRKYLNNSIVVSHTHFDRISIGKAFSRYSLEPLNSNWLDSAKVARRTWPEFSQRGYGLKNICNKIGYKFKHHDALEDAKAASQIIIEAMLATDLDLEDWLVRTKKPINLEDYNRAIRQNGNPEGELYGEVATFTGSLEITRKEAANLASSAGCSVTPNVTKKTTILIVGDQDITKLAGKNKSSKHLKAETLISKGHQIRIIRESDFIDLVT